MRLPCKEFYASGSLSVKKKGGGEASRYGRRALRGYGGARGRTRGRDVVAREAKPRTAPWRGGASREARRRDGDIAPYRQAARAVSTATGHGR